MAAADAFDFEAALDRPRVPPNAEVELKCRLTLTSAAGLATAVPSMTSNVCLVFDCSGSMAGKKLDTAIEAARMIVETIHERHRISLVGFATSARVLLDNERPTKDGLDEIRAKIEKIRDFKRGSTNLADGLKKGARVVLAEPSDAKVMIILSDGGADSTREAFEAGMKATEEGIQLFAVGIGDGYEADRLLKLVTPSNGAVFGETDLQKIKTTFEILIGRIESFVATHAQLQLTFPEGVKPGIAYKIAPEQAFLGPLAPDEGRKARLTVGNVERGTTYGFLFTLAIPPRKSGKLEIARAVLGYDAPSLGLKDQRKELPILVEYGALGQVDESVTADYRSARMAELAQELAEAQRRREKERSIQLLTELVALAGEQGDARSKAFYQELLASLTAGKAVGQESLNRAVVAASSGKPGRKAARGATEPPASKKAALAGAVELYDVVLLDAGSEVIRLVRELREATGLALREVSDKVKLTPAPIQEAIALTEAKALQKRIEGVGARVELRPHPRG